MKIAIIGASGFIGSAITAEALARGHTVTAIVSRPQRMAQQSGLTILGVDVNDTAALAKQIRGHELVISAFSGHAQSDIATYYLNGFSSILNAVNDAGVQRFLVVGGAASLLLPDGSMLLNSPDFPAEYRATAEGAYAALQLLRDINDIDWSYLSPAAEIFPGDKTAKFRVGQDHLLLDANGASKISTGDYAAAMLDEAEQPTHIRQRFSVAY